jgi:Fe-S cluster assembly iron-binding protein IscA
MIEITPEAQTKLGEYFQQNNLDSAVRVYLAQGG